jgi:mannobiose 2-epimerase
VNDLRQKVEAELTGGILPFWLQHSIDHERGGFVGRISDGLVIEPCSEKGLILNARILWTFSRAYRRYGNSAYRAAADRAYAYLTQYFWDPAYGGYFWMLDCDGKPTDCHKRIYGQAFTVYSLAEYFHACGEDGALSTALELVEKIEAAGHDPLQGGYFETYERDWSLAAEQRLSEVDMDEKRSMNTHLHLLEAYAALLRVHENPLVRARLGELIEIFLNRILNPATFHFQLFFDEQWRPRSRKVSFGHDIEGSWLLVEAAEILGDPALLTRVREAAVHIAQAVYTEALDGDGGLLYEGLDGHIHDSDKHWWPQAEAVAGFLNAWQISGQQHFLDAALGCWAFIEKRIIDRQYGEWFWLVSRDGVPGAGYDKAGPWKCPYHNSRTCFEVMERLDAVAAGQPAKMA